MSAKRPTRRHDPSPDGLFDVLGAKHRRDLLTVLCSQSGTVTLAELATELSKTTGRRERSLDGEMALRLHHVDLPKLESTGFLAYDSAERLVTFEPAVIRDALADAESALGVMRGAP